MQRIAHACAPSLAENKYTQVSKHPARAKIKRWVREGKLKAVRRGRAVEVETEHLEVLIQTECAWPPKRASEEIVDLRDQILGGVR